MKLKYIVIEHQGMEFALVLPSWVKHEFVGSNFKVVSAGFCKLSTFCDEESWTCWGESVSLGVGSRKEDAAILNHAMTFEM